METLFHSLMQIPASIWGVFLGSLLTLLGTWLNNRYHAQQSRSQLAHQSSENLRQDQFGLRSNLYVEAAAAIGEATTHLMSMSEIDLTLADPGQGTASFLAKIQKAALVGSESTSDALNEFTAEYGKSFFKLMRLLSPIHDARTERDIHDDQYKSHDQEVNRLLTAIKQYNETGQSDQTQWNVLNASFDAAQELRNESAQLRSLAWDQLNELSTAFKIEAMKELKHLAPLIVDATVWLRTDLGIATDITHFRKLTEKRIHEAQYELNQFIATLKAAAIDSQDVNEE